MTIDLHVSAAGIRPDAERLVARAVRIWPRVLDRWENAQGAPVHTVGGVWTARSWTEWTQGFLFGIPLLAGVVAGDRALVGRARGDILCTMPAHVAHSGVHDHGFTVVSTFGLLLRLMAEGRLHEADRPVCEMALRASGAVQASRWSVLRDEPGFIHSFNGPHSLFIDTMRTLRALALAHALGQDHRGEQDRRSSLLHRLLAHAETTARYNVFFGEGRDAFDEPGRVAHEAIFNMTGRAFRNVSTQQGWSPYTTWMRGLAWALLGYAELLPFLASRTEEEFPPWMTREAALARFAQVARVTAEFYIRNSTSDGMPFWDAGAPRLPELGDWRAAPADPFNDVEPIDSSAAVIAAQGFLRLALALADEDAAASARYRGAALTIARCAFRAPFLAEDPLHEGLLLHGVYHRPAGWDHVPAGRAIPCGEAVLWGDFHAVELAELCLRLADGAALPTFFTGVRSA